MPDDESMPEEPRPTGDQNVLRMWSGPVSLRQAATSIPIDDVQVSPTGADAPPEPEPSVVEGAHRPPRRALGVLALVAAGAGAVVEGVAIGVASAGDDLLGTVLAVLAIALTAVGAVLGIVAVVLGRGRIAGAVATVVGMLANPLVLVLVLRSLDPSAS